MGERNDTNAPSRDDQSRRRGETVERHRAEDSDERYTESESASARYSLKAPSPHGSYFTLTLVEQTSPIHIAGEMSPPEKDSVDWRPPGSDLVVRMDKMHNMPSSV